MRRLLLGFGVAYALALLKPRVWREVGSCETYAGGCAPVIHVEAGEWHAELWYGWKPLER